MARLQITTENQIQRLNIIINDVRSLKSLDLQSLTISSKPKSWCVLEVIEHMNIAYSFYQQKLDNALLNVPDVATESIAFKARPWQQLIINGQRPKNGKRKWKIKTLKRFEPLICMEEPNNEKLNAVFSNFEAYYGHLRQSILKSRRKDITKIKISSAIGPIVNFYIPECFEFLICHAERHLIQIKTIQDEQAQISV